jgi:uncharacterized protein (TIGR00255 family)
MIKSMTGFAEAEMGSDALIVMTEIRSYNSRHLDIVLRVNQRYHALEDKIKELVSEHTVRGRLEVKIHIGDDADDSIEFEIDKNRAKAYKAALLQIKDELDLSGELSIDHFIGLGGIIKPMETIRDTEIVWPVVENCLSQALGEHDVMRRKEGDFIAKDLSRRLDFIEDCINQIDQNSQGLLPLYQERLEERIAALTRGIVEIDPGRIAQEAAFLSDRSDISEEIVRAASHVNQFRNIMHSAEPAGRKLNFLLQELNREFNTMGSKIAKADTAHMVVELKSELEKIREQVQNVE